MKTNGDQSFARALPLVLVVFGASGGASLPAVSAWAGARRRGAIYCGMLYAANIMGAVIGCIVAGFYLLRLFDVNIASYTAIAINLSVALVTLALTRFVSHAGFSRASEARDVARSAGGASGARISI